MTTESLQKSIELIRIAQDHEGAGRFKEAIDAYARGCEWLLVVIKYEDSESARALMKTRMRSYMERGEQLKEHLSRKEPVRAATAAAAAVAEPMGVSCAVDKTAADLAARARSLVEMTRPNVSWTDVAGLDAAKHALFEAVVHPLKMSHLFERGRLHAWRGILLYGPPGTGKTMLAKAVATAANASTFVHVTVAGVMSKYVGDSEGIVKAIFRLARQEAPTIMFFDEIDCLAGERKEGDHDVQRKVMNQMLLEMDGLGSDNDGHVLVLAATNMPWMIDAAFMRRMQRRVFIPLPNAEARAAMIKNHARGVDACLSPDEVQALVRATDGWSGSDVATLVMAAKNRQCGVLSGATHFRTVGTKPDVKLYACEPDAPDAERVSLAELLDAGMGPKIEVPTIGYDDFTAVLGSVRPAARAADLERFEQFQRDHGSA